MSRVASRYFGSLEYTSGETFTFPEGLPGFPSETSFLPIEIPEQFPIVYLQSLKTPELCFVSVPVNCLVAGYQLAVSAEDLALVGFGPDAAPGPGMLCLALLCFEGDGTAVANLRAPLVVNVANRRAAQMIQTEAEYPVRFALNAPQETGVCC